MLSDDFGDFVGYGLDLTQAFKLFRRAVIDWGGGDVKLHELCKKNLIYGDEYVTALKDLDISNLRPELRYAANNWRSVVLTVLPGNVSGEISAGRLGEIDPYAFWEMFWSWAYSNDEEHVKEVQVLMTHVAPTLYKTQQGYCWGAQKKYNPKFAKHVVQQLRHLQ